MSGDPMPPADQTAAPVHDPQALPLTAEQFATWQSRIERSRTKRDLLSTEWQQNIDCYNGKPLSSRPTADWVNPNTDFADVEQKKAQLFFTTPTVHCTPMAPLEDGADSTILIKQAVLNDRLGPHGVDAKRLMDKVIFDALCPAGWGASKIGYEATTLPVDTTHPQTGETQTADVPVYEEFFWDHFSPKKLLVPDDFYDNLYDKAPWLGMEFSMPRLAGIRKYHLPEDFRSVQATDPALFDQTQGDRPDMARDLITGVEIWYKAALEDAAVFHPEVLRVLVLIDGLTEAPAKHAESPYQSLDPQGRLTPDSMIGFPIHVLTLRDLTDSAYIRSDCSMTRDLVDQLAKFLTTMTKQRDTSIPLRLYDDSIVTPDVLDKITSAEWNGFIGLPGGSLEQNPIREIARAQYPRENYEGMERILSQLAKTLALDSNQQGVQSDTSRTATELTLVQNSANVRLKAERNRVIGFFIAGVEKFDALLQRFASETTTIPILGPNGQQQWAAWNKKTIAGRYAYAIKPDSGVDIDEATERKQWLDVYNFLGKDPLVNRAYLIQELAPKLHLDPQKLKAEPPPPPVDKPSISFAFKGEDLLNPLAVAVMTRGGVAITAEDIAAAHKLIQAGTGLPPVPQALIGAQPTTTAPPQGPQGPQAGPGGMPPHPGMMPKTELVNDHAAQLTGKIAGAPGLPPSRVQ
jgi:hypothetical protein